MDPRTPGIEAAIGHTPMLRLSRLAPESGCEVFAKLEFMNPGGSIKDRIAAYILHEALRTHRLGPGDTVVEFSSGNTAVGIAMVAAALDLRAVLVVPAETSAEKRALLEALGARLVVAQRGHSPDDPSHGMQIAQRLARERGALYFDQFHNPLNPQAHYLTTGPEIWQQMRGRVDVLVAGMGTGGTISGTARYLKECNPNLKAVGVDAVGSILAGYIRGEPVAPAGEWAIEGIGSDIICRALDRSVIDEVVTVPDPAAAEMTREVARSEGILVGGSAGAALWAARRLALSARRPLRIAVIIPDSGARYSGKHFRTPAQAAHRTAEGPSLDRNPVSG